MENEKKDNQPAKEANKAEENEQEDKFSAPEGGSSWEDKVNILQDVLELEEEAAEKALELADGDVDKALEMGEFVDECYVIIHGKLSYGGYNKTYGLFYLIAEGKDGELLREDSVLNNNHDLKQIDLEVSNKAFAKTLADYTPLEEIKLGLKKNLSPAEIFDLYKYTKNDRQEEVRALVEDKLEEELEAAIELTVYSELKTKPQLENMYSNLFAEESEVEEESNTDSQQESNDDLGLNVVLNCLPVVSPTQGKRSEELSLGNRLLVKIVDDSELGNYFRNLLSNDSGLTTGIIEEINLEPSLSSYKIKIRFGPDIYGEVVVGTEIKVVSNPDEEVLKKEREVEGQKNSGLFNPLLLILLGTLIILIIILVSLYI